MSSASSRRVLGGCEREERPTTAAPPVASCLPPLPGRPAGLDVVEDAGQRVRTFLHVRHHAGPERTRSNGRRHQVRRVEPAGARLGATRSAPQTSRPGRVHVAVRPDRRRPERPEGSRLPAHRALEVSADEFVPGSRRPQVAFRNVDRHPLVTGSPPGRSVGTGTSRSPRRPPCPPGRRR